MPLVGRQVQLAAADAALRAADAGRGGVLLLTGEAGIGKTSVLSEIAARARLRGAVVRWAGCWEGGAPLMPWLQVLRRPGDDGCALVGRRITDGEFDLEPSADAVVAARGRDRLHGAVADALWDATLAAPQVVVLDDLQWADDGSLLLLRAVAAQAPVMRLLVAGAYRDDETPADGPLNRLAGPVERVALCGLAEPDVAALMRDILTDPTPDEQVHAIRQQTGGNPFFVVELTRLLESGSPVGVSLGVRDVLGRRLARLPSGCVQVLVAAAVLGVEFEPAVVSEISGLPSEEVLDALDRAQAARLVQRSPDRPDRWSFGHALVQAARYEAIGSVERQHLHRATLRVLARRARAPAAVLAHHAALAGFDPDDATPAELSLAAGAAAGARLDPVAALGHYERAFGQAPAGGAGDVLRAHALLGVGTQRLRLGEDPAAAGHAFAASARLARSLGDSELLAAAALGFGAGLGGFEIDMLDRRQAEREAAAALDDSSPLRSGVLARLSVAEAFTADDDARLALADEALALASAHDDPVGRAGALASRCDALAGPDHVRRRLADADAIVGLGREMADRRVELLGRRFRLVALAELCEMAELDREVTAFERSAAELGDPLYSWYGPLWRGMRALTRGQLGVAAELAGEARTIGRRAGSRNARVLTRVLAFFTAWASGDVHEQQAQFRAMAEVGELMLANGGPGVLYFAFRAGAPADTPQARRLLDGLDAMPVDAEWLPAMALLVDLAHELGLTEYAPRLLERLSPYAGLGVVEGIGAAHRGPVDRWLTVLAADLGSQAATQGYAASALRIAAQVGPAVLADTQQAVAAALRVLGPSRWGARAAELEAAAGSLRAAFGGAAATVPPPPPVPRTGGSVEAEGSLVRDGDSWAVTWAGTTVRLRDAKGLADLAVLLARPGREVHVRELAVAPVPEGGPGDPVLDERAVAGYRRRLLDLEAELDEADRFHDAGRSAALAAERDALVAQLREAFGLGGRARRLGGDTDERLRKAVAARLRATVERTGRLHPALGRHLRNAVRTGTWCSYQPERPTRWLVRR